MRCRLHHKDTNFKANHNYFRFAELVAVDVDCTTKIRILKQITTRSFRWLVQTTMSIAPQRYEF
mgnify:CR=1 FL=1